MPDEAVATAEVQTSIPRFLVVNASELLERLAYYGVVSVNVLYMIHQGYGGLVAGLVSAILLALPYIMPMVASPLAARAGYKAVMLAAFVAYAAGFLAIAASPTALGFVAGAVLVGLGAGMFKPLTAASIAYVTSERQRTFGYTVYYVGINVGGFIGPILMSLFGGHYRLAYLLGAATIGVDFLFILALFRNPLPPKPGTSLSAAFRPLVEVLANGRFLVLLAIFAGFWFVYSMALTFIIPYLQAYVALPGWFKPNLQVSLESLSVVVLGIPLGSIASARDGVRMMTFGITLLVIGFLIVGFVPSFWPYVIGILLIASGEVIAYPGFLSYVSRIAPRDRVAVYQGFGFLPLFVGFLIGPIVGGGLYKALIVEARRPSLFWAIMDCVGVATLAAFLLYARALRPAPAPGAAPTSWWQGRAAAAVVVLLGVALVVAGLAAGTRVPLAPGQASGGGQPLSAIPLGSYTGSTNEGQTTTQVLSIPARTTNVTVSLTWSDEPPGVPLPGATNQPDTFKLEIRDASGTVLAQATGSNPPGGQGNVTVAVPEQPSAVTLTAAITLTTAGDTQALGQTAAADQSNSWSLTARGVGPAAR